MYEEVVQKLQASFGAGSLSQGRRPYIPSQVYMLRLEQVAGELWSWRVINDPVIDTSNMLVTVRGEIQLCDAIRQGIGVAVIQKLEPTSIKNAISSAESEAFRDCCDKFLMGWRDIANSREWGANPHIKAFVSNENPLNAESYTSIVDQSFNELVEAVNGVTKETCSVCRKLLTPEEYQQIKNKGIRYYYCSNHFPKQFR
ncbi:MAG: hypothetical protein ABS939_02930 [Psychrobacillus sp.]